MPLNRRDLVSSSVDLLQEALLALQTDQQAVDFLHGQDLTRGSDGDDDKTISQLQIILRQLSCQVNEYLQCNESSPSSEGGRFATEKTVIRHEEEQSLVNDEPTNSSEGFKNNMLSLDLGERPMQLVQMKDWQSAFNSLLVPTRNSRTFGVDSSLNGDKSTSEPFNLTQAESHKQRDEAEAKQEPVWRASSMQQSKWRASSIQEPCNMLRSLSLNGESYRPLEETGSTSSPGLDPQSEFGLVQGCNRTSKFRCRIELTQSFYQKRRSYTAHDFYDYGEKPYSLRAVLQSHSSPFNFSSVKDLSRIGFELRVMADQQEPISDHLGKHNQHDEQLYRTYSICFPFKKACHLGSGRSASIKKFSSCEASSMMTEQLPADLVKILGRREGYRFLTNVLCLEWECDAGILTSHANGNGLPDSDETIAWPAVSCAALLFLKLSQWGGRVRVYVYIDDEEELEYWKTQGLPAFFKA